MGVVRVLGAGLREGFWRVGWVVGRRYFFFIYLVVIVYLFSFGLGIWLSFFIRWFSRLGFRYFGVEFIFGLRFGFERFVLFFSVFVFIFVK